MLRSLHRHLHSSSPRSSSLPFDLRSLHHQTLNPNPQSPDPSTSLTVSYLTATCGLSFPSALSAAANIRLKSTSNPDAVLSLLKSHGFTATQITTLIAKYPRLLSAHPSKNLHPKLVFLRDIAATSGTDLASLVSAVPNLLFSSLDKRLIPNYNLLTSITTSHAAVAAVLRNSSILLRNDLSKLLLPNINILRDAGVPEAWVSKLAVLYPRVLMQSSDRFRTTVDRLKALGFNPYKVTFVLGVNAMSGLTTATWERKLAVYRSVGWSEEEIMMAFKRYPFCMLVSEDKIRKVMDLCVNKLGLDPSFVSLRPILLLLSLEKRILPRCSVMSILMSRGLTSKKVGSCQFLFFTNKMFLKKFVTPHLEEAPELLEAYQGKIEFIGFEKAK